MHHDRLKVTILGGGMITHDQILPSLYQLQRLGIVGDIVVIARHESTLRALADSPTIRRAFPEASFGTTPDPTPGNLVFIALPDHLHYEAIMQALQAGQHVISGKPLVLKVAESEAIEAEARRRGLFVGIEYHKRFDDRSLIARRKYRAGEFGEFRLGTAHLMEKWSYRHSNFQNWCTTENSDAFTYIGCHYVDLVHFITGLLPASVSVYGVRDRFPNGNEGFLWTDARIVWNNGACLNVQNSLGYPDDGPGSNTQGMALYCASGDRGTMLRHSDQYRGLEYVDRSYSEPSPDYFQYVDLGGPGLTPVGYGHRSIEQLVRAVIRVRNSPTELDAIEREGILATPANSRYNEQVIEAARKSILAGGITVPVETAHANEATR